MTASAVVRSYTTPGGSIHTRRCPEPEPAGRAAVVEIDEVWHFLKKRPAGSGS